MNTANTTGAMPLTTPLLRFTVDGRRYIGDRSFFASTDLELFARLAEATPRDGVWTPGQPGRMTRVGDVPGSLLVTVRSRRSDRGAAAVWTARPDVTMPDRTIDAIRDGAPVSAAIVPWTLASHTDTVEVDGRKIDAIQRYGAGQDITWRIHPDERMVSGWWGDESPTPILAALVMGLGPGVQ